MDSRRIDEIIDGHGAETSALIQVMLDIQGENHWLPRDAIARIHERLGVPLARIRHIATFYKAFSLVPKGRHQVHVCTGTACHVRGASQVLHTVAELTGLEPGETDMDLKFSLETVNCLGCCALGPVIEIDGKTHGNVSSGKTEKVLAGVDGGAE
ncbi:MAG: NAD(P)H-dependent oxidoreductase subunit E [Planctomycetota bacterium]